MALVVGAIVPNASPTSTPTTATADPLAVLRSTANDLGMGDPDLPPVGRHVDRKTYLQLRAQQTNLYRGAPFPRDRNARVQAIQKFERQLAGRGKAGPTWTAIGPAPIPNGQTTPTNPVSGRVTAIAVDPTDANVVYVGTANGGVWRSKNGGTSWTPLMDDAESLAIGSLAIPPSDNSILYVGTGEGNLSGDSYAGVGLYRINSANGTTPAVNGPFEARVGGNGHAFQFMAIQGIAVDPANAARVYVSATPGGIGMGNDWLLGSSTAADPGLYLTTTGTASTPQFSKVGGGLPQTSGSFFPASTDVKFMPGSSTTLLVGIEDVGFGTSANNGIWRSTNANAGAPTFTKISLPNTVFNTRIATGPSSTVIVAAESNVGGRVYKSTDSGATFVPPDTLTTANGFCGGQCFYDMAPAISPSDATKMVLGGSADTGGANVLMRATDGVNFSSSDAGLHADSHATAYAPSNSSIVYAGNDGGIWKSTNGGTSWVSLNNSQFSATQFESIAVHPSDPNFSIGGTQDNGTNWYTGTWNRNDFGDGGFAAIDQNAANTTNVTMYHTYFNQKNGLVGYAFVTSTATASDGNWGFRGCGNGVTTANSISCSEDPLFYAPLELGPGNPNTVYYGTNVLHRSTDKGVNNPVVSQSLGGGPSGRISAIGISPQNDNVRIIGGSGGQILGTTSGSSSLDNLDASNTIPNKYVARVVIDPNNADTAYVTVDGFTGGTGATQSHVWKTTNINGTSTAWTAKNSGLPDVPVNAMVVDPNDSNDLYIGTDVGVYASTNGGTSWTPFGTGLPVVPIFDMAIAQPGTGSEVLRVATHGRGMYEALLGTAVVDTTKPTASLTQPSKTVTINNSKTITVAWNANDTGGSGLDDVDLRVKSAKFNANFGAFTQPAALQHLSGTSKVFTGVAGTSYCFSVRARDHAANLSAFSPQKCSMLPVDDKTAAGTGWSRKTGQAGAYLGTLSVSSTKNRTLTLNNLHARQVGVMVKKCSNCGTFTITFNGQTFSADTAGSGFTVFTIPATSTVKISNLVIKVFSSGKPVQIDGIAAPQTGAITLGSTAPAHRVR